MKKSQLAQAIKSVLAENKIRQAVKQVLAEQKPINEEPIEGFSELDYLRNYISHASATFDTIVRKIDNGENIPSNLLKSVQTQLASAEQWVRNKEKNQSVDEQTINEEVYDTIQDIANNVGSRPSQDAVEDYLGRTLNVYDDDDKDIMKAFGFDTRVPYGHKHGQPQYAPKSNYRGRGRY